jgi:hypothetical protein
MREPGLCVGCGRSLAGGGDRYISRGGLLCRPCSDSVSRQRGTGAIPRHSGTEGAGYVRAQWLGPDRQLLP